MKQAVVVCTLSLLFLPGCPHIGGTVRVGGGSYIDHTPPAHAPAHGHRRNHRYHYYPNAEIYFDIGRNMYFYLDSGNRWSFSADLPLRLRSHLHSGYVEIEMDDDRPYSRHKSHKKKYKNYKFKNKRRYSDEQQYREKTHRKKSGRNEYDDEHQYREKKHRKKNGRNKYDDERR